jgi:dephospho-CoA kinase
MSAVLRIALTGGIGSGKTTVSSIFEKLGVPIIDSDIISRDLVKPGQPCLTKIINEFGNEILTEQNTLDREKLRSIIFDDDVAKSNLESILHPSIYKELDSQISKINYPYCLVVVPLLIETNAMKHFDRILVIDTDKDLQVKRTQKRDNSSEIEVKKIIDSQISREQRLKYADDIIENTLTIEELNETVKQLHTKYIELGSHNN